MTLPRHRVAAAVASVWRHAPVRGPGRVMGQLVRPGDTDVVIGFGPGRLAVSIDNPAEWSVFVWRRYEDDVGAALRFVLLPGDTAYDVGANCGVLSMRMRQLVGARGGVVAIDPSPEACARVRSQAALNGYENVRVVEAALADTVAVPEYRRAKHGLGALPLVDVEHTTDVRVAVRGVRLDDLVEQLATPPALLKIDTDGHELSILSGSLSVLQRFHPALVFELNPTGLARRGHDPAALLDLVRGTGYEILEPVWRPSRRWVAAPPRLAGYRALGDDAPTGSAGNLLALRADDARHRAARSQLVS